MMKTPDRKIILLLSLFFLMSGSLLAAQKADNSEKFDKEDTKNPIGCHDLGYEFDLKTLRLVSHSVGARQTLYFLYNKSQQSIILYQMLGEESARSMYLNHKIDARQWAILSTSARKMKYLCSVADGKNPYGKIADCSDVLQVCEYNHVKFGMNNQGNYWLVNSSTKNGAINAVVHYGIIPGV